MALYRGGCLKFLVPVLQRQQVLCKNHTLSETCDRHGPFYQILVHPGDLALVEWAIGYAVCTSDLMGDLGGRDVGHDRQCERVFPFLQNLGRPDLAQLHCHDTKSQCRELEGLRMSIPLRAGRLENSGERDQHRDHVVESRAGRGGPGDLELANVVEVELGAFLCGHDHGQNPGLGHGPPSRNCVCWSLAEQVHCLAGAHLAEEWALLDQEGLSPDRREVLRVHRTSHQ